MLARLFQMRVFLTLLLSNLLTGVAIGQTRPEAAPVEMAVKSLFDAIHRGDLDAVGQFYSKEGKLYLAAGAELDPKRPGASRIFEARKACALYVRHVQMLTADAAYIVALRRCPEAPASIQSATLDITMRREPGGWKVMSWREGALEGIVRAKPETTAPSESPLLSAQERADNWISLFDGKSFRGWMSPSGEDAPPSWRIVDGAMATVPRSAGAPIISLRTQQEFVNFDLKFEWMVNENANSGCIYRLFALGDGMEYQIADDNGDPGARVDPRQRSGALYGVTSVEKSVARPIGQWNEARIRVTSNRIEHWLNDIKTAEYPVDVPLPSPIVLQYHFTEVRFRNLRIRRLP